MIYQSKLFYFRLDRTFWEKRVCGVKLWKRTSWGAYCIWGLHFGDYEKTDKRDNEYYKKKYNIK